MSLKRQILGLMGAALLVPLMARANVTPNALFSDHAVLQQAMDVPVWGTADAGESVAVSIGGQTQNATAGADGKWMVHLPRLAAGGPMVMTITGNNTITINDVLVGEVWVGSGQSNMQFTVSAKAAGFAGLTDEAKEIAAANYPQLRMFMVGDQRSLTPMATIKGGKWQICTPTTVPAWSAVGYLFGRDLQRELKMPVGIVVSAVGASTAEAWISRDALVADPLLKPMVDRLDAAVKFFKENPRATADKAPVQPWPMNKALPSPTRPQSNPLRDQHQPITLFNGLIAPIIPYAMRGVIWYQGESICGGDAGVSNYGHVQATLVTDWRARWGEGNFPFIIVQLPPQANLSNNPRVREQQATILSLPNTGMAVTLDIGEEHNVHPHNKAPLGERLTKIALANAYGQKIEYSGPMYQSMKIDGSTIRVSFTHVGGGLVAKGGPLKWFQIAGADQKFVDAKATIDGETVVVSSDQVSSPVAVRYAFADYPNTANLFNKDDLPAAPFRSDTWTYKLVGITEER